MPDSVFVARFRSRCACGCDEPIEPGDDARSSTSGWIRAGCDPPEPAQARASRPTPPPCGRCFQIPAANGACGCDS